MKNLIVLFFVSFATLLSCGQKSEIKGGEIYFAKKEFGKVSNQIDKFILDSLIGKLPYWRLGEFKTTNFLESLAVEILKTELMSKKNNINEFIIIEINRVNDSILIFNLDHLDYMVYKYNLDKLNAELAKKPNKEGYFEVVPPITGNVSGYSGSYFVNIVSGNIRIEYVQ